jgi:hypothetical protein
MGTGGAKKMMATIVTQVEVELEKRRSARHG